MISKQELMALAAELQLQAHVVEKDYALGWFAINGLVWGMRKNPSGWTQAQTNSIPRSVG